MAQHGVLLVNLGTPDSPRPSDVRRYLYEFLTDGRVIDMPWAYRQLLVRAWIVPRRYRTSASLYSRIWTPLGSPLLLHTEAATCALQEALGEDYSVSCGMRYGNPSIGKALQGFEKKDLKSLTILPLFPQYASATTGSVHECVMQHIARWQVIPRMHWIHSYPAHPLMIDAFAKQLEAAPLEQGEHVLMSFHGVPESHLRKADASQRCLCHSSCCVTKPPLACYRAQCMQTAQALIERLQLEEGRYSIAFQSRLGKDPWTQPYTDVTIENLAKQGVKRLAVMAPAFTADCLETLDEIGREYAELFKHHGGQALRLVPSLNSHPAWIAALRALVMEPSLCTP